MLEMILVLALLVAVGAMVLPAMQGPMSDQRLRKAADLIRAQWTRARVRAMQSGQVHVFRYDVASDRYLVELWQGEFETDASAMAAQHQQSPWTSETDDSDQPLGIDGQQLPSGITFFTGETTLDRRALQIGEMSSGNGTDDGGPPPIVFYPDGTTTDARIVLTNERFFVEV
jgi:Tfp pilus assembly protein FimT